MTGLEQGRYITFTVAQVEFVMRRRHTALMLQVGDVRRVLGLLHGAMDNENPEGMADASAEYVVMQQRMFQYATVKVAGEPYDPEVHTWDVLAPYSDAVWRQFLGSGLSVDPTPGSCEGQPEPS